MEDTEQERQTGTCSVPVSDSSTPDVRTPCIIMVIGTSAAPEPP